MMPFAMVVTSFIFFVLAYMGHIEPLWNLFITALLMSIMATLFVIAAITYSAGI